MSAGALETQIAKDNLQALLIYAIAATVFTVCFANDYIIFLFLSSCSSLFFYLGESILHTFWNSLFLPLFLLKWFSFIMVFFFFYFQELFSNTWLWVRGDFPGTVVSYLILSQERLSNRAATFIYCKMSTGTSKNRYNIGLPIQRDFS